MKVLGIVSVLILLFTNVYGINNDENTNQDKFPYLIFFHTSMVVMVVIVLLWKKLEKIPSPFHDLTLTELETLEEKVTANLRTMLTIYGILLGFIITTQYNKISFDNIQLFPILWLSVVFSIILHAISLLYNIINDKSVFANQRNRLENDLYYAHEFLVTSIILLAVLLATIPLFNEDDMKTLMDVYTEYPEFIKIFIEPWFVTATTYTFFIFILINSLIFYTYLHIIHIISKMTKYTLYRLSIFGYAALIIYLFITTI